MLKRKLFNFDEQLFMFLFGRSQVLAETSLVQGNRYSIVFEKERLNI